MVIGRRALGVGQGGGAALHGERRHVDLHRRAISQRLVPTFLVVKGQVAAEAFLAALTPS